MRDPREGRSADGMIVTGASAERIAPAFRDVLDAAVAAVTAASPGAALFVYGSVATGQAEIGRSDVDLLAIGVDAGRASSVSTELSGRFAGRCRDVSIGAAAPDDVEGERDEAYGNQVFLRHYCVHLTGPTGRVPTDDFPADERAARGFNGDIARHRDRWRSELAASTDPGGLAMRIARKTLLAVAGLVSMHDDTWTTDRSFAATRWAEIEPGHADDLATLFGWIDQPPDVDQTVVARMIDDLVDPIAERFRTDIGLWP